MEEEYWCVEGGKSRASGESRCDESREWDGGSLTARVETSEDYAKKYYIKTHDERLQHIMTEANAVAMKLSLYILGICTSIGGCFDAKVFLALLLTFFGELFIYLGSYLYYKHKN